MNLTLEEYREYLSAHLRFLYFVGKQEKIISNEVDFMEFVEMDYKVKFKCRQLSYKHKSLFDNYLKNEQNNLSSNEIEILSGFKKSISGDFVIYKCLTNNAIFINTKDNSFYAVKSLSDPFTHFFEYFPVLVKATIVPFKEKIIYDGFFEIYNMSFGSGWKETLKNEYNKAKQLNRIIKTIE